MLLVQWISLSGTAAFRTWRYFLLTGGSRWVVLAPAVVLLLSVGVAARKSVGRGRRHALLVTLLLLVLLVQVAHMQRWVNRRAAEGNGDPSWSVPASVPSHCSNTSLGGLSAWLTGQRLQHPVVCGAQLDRELRWEYAHAHGQCDFSRAPPLEDIAPAELLTPDVCRALRERGGGGAKATALNKGKEDEKSAAIAFVVIAYQEAPLLRRLLRALLRRGEPHAAMVLLDLEAPPALTEAVLRVARDVAGGGRVCVARSGRVAYHSATALRALLAAFRWWGTDGRGRVRAAPWWRWIVPMSGADFPLRAPHDIVRTLLRHGGGSWQAQPSCCDPATPKSCPWDTPT